METKGATGEETISYWFVLPIDVAEFEEKLGVGAESGDYRIIEKVLPYADEVHEHTSVYQLNELDFMYRQLSSDMQEEYVSLLRDELLEMLRDFIEKDEERSILISSHISSDLETLCDDLYMIHQGKVIMHEDTDVLLSDYALLKVDEEEYSKLDRQYILRTKKESYGYSCLTNQKQYYAENYPQIAIEKGNIDEVITMMIRGVE